MKYSHIEMLKIILLKLVGLQTFLNWWRPARFELHVYDIMLMIFCKNHF
jgi:hypothetical protein